MKSPSGVNNVNGAPPSPENGHGALQPRPMLSQPFAGPLAPAAASAAPNALALLQALRRRLVPALIVGLMVAAIAGAATWFLMPPPKITARTQLHVAPAPPKILFAEINQSHYEHEQYLRTQAHLIRDRFVLNAALREPEIAELSLLKEQPDPLQWLEQEIKVEFPSPEFMRITLSGDRPSDQLKIVKAVTKAYLDNVVNKEHNERLARMEQIRKVKERFEQRWQRQRADLRKLQEQNGALNEKGLAILQQVALEELQGAKKDLAQVRHELRRLQVELGMRPDWLEQIWPQYAAILNGLPGPGLPINHAVVALLHDDALVAMASPAAQGLPPSRELEELIDKDQTIVEKKKQIEKLHAEMDAMEKTYLPKVFQQLVGPKREQLAVWEKSLERRRQELRPKYYERLRQQLRLSGQGDRNQMQDKYRTLKEFEKLLLSEVTRLATETKQIKKNAVDLAQLQEDIDNDKELKEHATKQITAMEVEQEAPPRITQPDKEAVLYTPDANKRKLITTSAAAVVSLALVLLAFAWFEFQSRKVHTPDQVVQGLGLHLMGTVPDLSSRSWLPWPRGSESNSAYMQSLLTESVDAARIMLLHVAHQEQLKIILITSALAGEGKTSLASHLAASLARAGRRTILVDSDLRNPTLHRLFERSRAPGLSELLRGEIDVSGVSRDTGIPNLWLISAGKADASALQALAFDTIAKLFEQLRSQYDFVIVDSCPVLPVADAMLVSQHVDAVIFSLLREVSRLPRVHAAYQRLAWLGIRMLGAVVNGTHHDSYATYDYHYVNPPESD